MIQSGLMIRTLSERFGAMTDILQHFSTVGTGEEGEASL
jgi:hypothetical protein